MILESLITTRIRLILIAGYFCIPLLLPAQPLQNRLLLATSRDGLIFTKQHVVIFKDADVPDAVIDSSGRVFLYFQGNQDPARDVIMVGTSADGISGWTFQPAILQGLQSWKVRPCDPDVLYKDGLFRLYVTGDPSDDRIPETYSLTSRDGLTFTLEGGVRFSGGNLPALDPSLLWTGDTLHYFAGGGAPNRNWHAVSTDGLTFTRLTDFAVDAMMMSNGIAVPGGYRFYGFRNTPPQDIRSIFSTDGRLWIKDAGVRLSVDPSDPLEGMYVKDPAIVRRDSLFLMYYVTRKKEFTGIERSESNVPATIRLGINAPNPCDGTTTIPFSLSRTCRISLTIRDMLGRSVATPLDAEYPPGDHAVVFNATHHTCGQYLIILAGGGAIDVRRMVVAR